MDYHGTLEDTSDDIHIIRKDITNQDGVEYSPYYFYSFAQDLNNQIWVGTSEGLCVIEDPDDFIQNDDFRFTQIKIARNAGTDYADYLLNGVNISSIAIDAANRKWIGTVADGVYLVSADGQEMQEYAKKTQGMRSLMDSAIDLVKEGVTTPEEVMKIAYYSD